MMALTAKSTRRAVVKLLDMVHQEIVSVSPNIKYSVGVNVRSFEKTFAPLVVEFGQKGDHTIFCHTYTSVHEYKCLWWIGW